MIVCLCRGISDKDYPDEEKLKQRLLEPDKQCCSCIRSICKEMCHERVQEITTETT